MAIAKEKMTSKRFIPILSDIPEEELYHTIDLGWDIPCARRGRRFSAISLKRENSRRAVHCGGCPGCDNSEKEQKAVALVRSNSCKTCVSDDYKQKIVRKWLDDVPLPPATTRPVKSVAKVSGTPRVVETTVENTSHRTPEPIGIEEPKALKITELNLKEALHAIPHMKEQQIRKEVRKEQDQKIVSKTVNSKDISTKEEPKTKAPTMVTLDKRSPPSHGTRRVRKRLPPPPPPPILPAELPKDEEEPIPPEVKVKMQAVIRELNQCRRAEPKELEEVQTETIAPIAPKIVIPVLAADSHYFSDDNLLTDTRRRDQFIDFDSLERNNLLKKRRFSLACGPEISHKDIDYEPNIHNARERLSRSWRDVRTAVEGYQVSTHSVDSEYENRSLPVSEVFINTMEPLYNNLPTPGPLTIQVRGSPVENRRNVKEDFDPDTLDRKPRRDTKKRVDKILLKSGGSFKHKFTEIDNNQNKSPEVGFTRKIGSLRQIYEAKTKIQDDSLRLSFYERRGSVPYGNEEISRFVDSLKTPDLIRQINGQKELRPPVPPKQRRGSDLSPKFCTPTRESPPGERRRALEDRDRFPAYSRAENLNARRSGRRLPRTRSRRTDLRKLYKTEDSGYMSTDSNESKRRARYLMQLRPKTVVLEPTMVPAITISNKTPPLQIESDTDELESLCDGRSESGGESVETDSVFFGNFEESKQMLAELGMYSFDGQKRIQSQEQIDSGFMGETNIILSGDSDSEHRSVISIIAGRDGRASAASIAKLDDPPFVHSVEC